MEREFREEAHPPSVAGVDPGAAERRLIESARNGNREAFGRLIRLHQKRLFRFVYGLTGSFDHTEDIVQEAFVKAYTALARFESDRDFYPWLATIARNLAFNLLRREQKKESLDQMQQQGFDAPSAELGPLEQVISSEGQKRFYQALNALPAKYRTVFVLRHFEDMSYDDIAAQLRIPPGTVDSRLYRARQMLLETLKDLL